MEREWKPYWQRCYPTRTETGNAGVVRNGYLPEELQTGLGGNRPNPEGPCQDGRSCDVPIGPGSFGRRSPGTEVPKGVSSGEMGEALVLVGPQAQGLSTRYRG